MDLTLRCPVCRAAFRGSRECSRCGADLGRLMEVCAEAYIERRYAAHALHRGDYEAARDHAVSAQMLCATPRGRKLELLTRWLASTMLPSS